MQLQIILKLEQDVTLDIIIKEFGICISMARKKYNRKPKVDYALLNAFMREQSAKVNGVFSQRNMLQWVRDNFGFGSFWMINKVFKEYKWTKVRYICCYFSFYPNML